MTEEEGKVGMCGKTCVRNLGELAILARDNKMFHVEHFSQRAWQPMLEKTVRGSTWNSFSLRADPGTLRDSCCGKIVGNASQLFRPARESLLYISAPKSVIAIRSRFELFCELKLSASPKKLKWDASSL
jgi:hypothetical protein